MREDGKLPAILVFLKAPVPGQVKTRLARDLGDEAACEIYRRMVERQLAALPSGWPVEIHFAPTAARTDFAAWLGPGYVYFPQIEGDLGLRLRFATAAAFERGHPGAILIGGDCPALDASDLKRAAHCLASGTDVAIGPASDGGYYLLGLRAVAEALLVFEDVPWSTERVAQVTIERVKALGLRLTQLEEKEDVDDLASYRRAVTAGRLPEHALPSGNSSPERR